MTFSEFESFACAFQETIFDTLKTVRNVLLESDLLFGWEVVRLVVYRVLMMICRLC